MALPTVRSAGSRFLLLAALAAWGGCGAPGGGFRHQPATPVFEGEEQDLPCERFGDAFFVHVMVEGRGPFRFLLDTGSNATVVDAAVAATLGVPVHRAAGGITGATGRRVVADRVLRGIEIRSGDVVFPGTDAVVVDLAGPSGAAGRAMDGILGFPMFVERTLVLDWPGGRVRLSRRPLPPPDGDTVLPLMGGYRPSLVLDIAGAPRTLLLDSGSNGSLSLDDLPPPDALQGAPVPWLAPMTITGRGASAHMCRLRDDLRIGRHGIRRPLVRVQDGVPTLGTRILRAFVVTLDSSRGRVRFEGPETPAPEAPLRGTGAALLREGDAWRILEVLSDSPAASSGLRPGMRVLSVSGHAPGTVDLATLAEVEDSLAYVIEEPDGTRRVEVPVREYL